MNDNKYFEKRQDLVALLSHRSMLQIEIPDVFTYQLKKGRRYEDKMELGKNFIECHWEEKCSHKVLQSDVFCQWMWKKGERKCLSKKNGDEMEEKSVVETWKLWNWNINY